MEDRDAFDFAAKLKDDERLVWTGRGSGRNLSWNILFPMVAVATLGAFLILGYPLSGFRGEMGLVALWGLVISGIVLWFFRARMVGPSTEEYAISTNRILIVSGPIGRICRAYVPTPKKRTARSGLMFYAIKHVKKRDTIVFLPARAKTMPQGYPPVFTGIENSLQVAELAAKTFDLKLIKR